MDQGVILYEQIRRSRCSNVRHFVPYYYCHQLKVDTLQHERSSTFYTDSSTPACKLLFVSEGSSFLEYPPAGELGVHNVDQWCAGHVLPQKIWLADNKSLRHLWNQVYALYDQGRGIGMLLLLWFLVCQSHNTWIGVTMPRTVQAGAACIPIKSIDQAKHWT